ncbi:hypothetical protein [Hydrogenimonas sp.]
MLRILPIIILMVSTLFSSMLLNENIYERENRIDFMLSFDTPFTGKITKKRDTRNTVDILLTDVEIQRPFYKSFRNSFVESIAVTRTGMDRILVKIVPSTGPIGVQASKTVDGFGLRLRIYPVETVKTENGSTPPLPAILKKEISRAGTEKSATSEKKPLNLLEGGETLPGWRYWTVLLILLLLLIFFLVVRKRRMGKSASGKGWLMPKGTGLPDDLPAEAIVRFQKPLDAHNRLVLIEFGRKQYLIVTGNGNLLLDTFSESHIEAEEEFAHMFEVNKKQLDNFLKEHHPDAYEAFKANASKEEHL